MSLRRRSSDVMNFISGTSAEESNVRKFPTPRMRLLSNPESTISIEDNDEEQDRCISPEEIDKENQNPSASQSRRISIPIESSDEDEPAGGEYSINSQSTFTSDSSDADIHQYNGRAASPTLDSRHPDPFFQTRLFMGGALQRRDSLPNQPTADIEHHRLKASVSFSSDVDRHHKSANSMHWKDTPLTSKYEQPPPFPLPYKSLISGKSAQSGSREHGGNTCSPSTKKKRSNMMKPTDLENPAEYRLRKLRRYIFHAGLFPKYDKIFQNARTLSDKARILEDFLLSKGLKKPFAIEKCKQFKADREFQKDVSNLDKKKIIGDDDEKRITRSKTEMERRNRRCGKVLEWSDSSSSEDEGREGDNSGTSSSSEDQVDFSSLGDIVSVEDD